MNIEKILRTLFRLPVLLDQQLLPDEAHGIRDQNLSWCRDRNSGFLAEFHDPRLRQEKLEIA